MQTEPYSLTAAAVGRIIGVSGQAVRAMARDGVLPHLQLPSGRLRFRPSDVRAFLRAHTVGGGEAA